MATPYPTRSPFFVALAQAAAAVAAASGLAWLASPFVPHATLSLLYLAAVLMVASRSGPAVAASTGLASFLALNFLFTDPQFTFQVDDDTDLVTLLFFLLVAIFAGNLAARMRREVMRAEASVQRLSSLRAFGDRMLSALDAPQVLERLERQVQDTFGTQARVRHVRSEPASTAGAIDGLRHPVDAVCLPVGPAREPVATVELNDLPAGDGTAELAQSLCHQATLALERVTLSEALARAQLVSQAEELRSALLASVSHDLRTPLASIIGSSSSLIELERELSDTDRRTLLATVLAEARRLDNYIQNLLDMTRLGHGSLALHRDWIDVRDLIAGACARLHPTPSPPPPISLRIAEALPMIWVHGALVEQALVNLLDNAARVSPVGASIEILAGPAADGLEISICDEGPGIAPDLREQVFEMFFSAPAGDRDTRQGTGLGLAICRGMIGAHGGTVEAFEGPGGRGTRMRVWLPVTPAAEGDAT